MIIPFKSKQAKLTSTYGERILQGSKQFHSGYDLVGINSDIVTAAVGGTVVVSKIVTDKNNLTWQWGNYVCIKTNSGEYHYYCHLKERKVQKGDTVKYGDIIGIMGNTGYSFGKHLHFECRKGNAPFSPEAVLLMPNKTGEYKDTLAEDLTALTKIGLITSPEYWQEHGNDVKYLPELLHKITLFI